MSKIRLFFRSHPILIAVIALVLYLFFSFGFFGFGEGIVREISARFIIAAILLCIMSVIAGLVIIKPSSKGLGFAFRKASYLLAITFVSSFLAYLSLFSEGSEIVPNWAIVILEVALLCLAIGLFEEALFRGIIFNALLAKLGSTRRGILLAAIVSSLIFGFAHVYSYFIIGAISSPLALAQAIMKTLQTAMVGFLLCAIYIKTRNIWHIAIIHGLFDFFPTLPSFLQGAQSPSADYVSSSPELSTGIIAVYLILIIVNIPLVIIGWRIINRITLPNRGFFTDDWTAPPRAIAFQSEEYPIGFNEPKDPT